MILELDEQKLDDLMKSCYYEGFYEGMKAGVWVSEEPEWESSTAYQHYLAMKS